MLCRGSCNQLALRISASSMIANSPEGWPLTGWVQAGPVNRIKELCATFKIESEVFLCTRLLLQLLLLDLLLLLYP